MPCAFADESASMARFTMAWDSMEESPMRSSTERSIEGLVCLYARSTRGWGQFVREFPEPLSSSASLMSRQVGPAPGKIIGSFPHSRSLLYLCLTSCCPVQSMRSRISPRMARGTGRSSMVFNPGPALITWGIMFTHMAMVPMPPGTSGLMERLISGVPLMVT
jgi:hypothetical protein